MNLEHRYFAAISALGLAGFLGLGGLMSKYQPLIFGYWTANCQSIGQNFFSGRIHYMGLGIVVFMGLVTGMGIVRLGLSLIKTRQRTQRLLDHPALSTPAKLWPLIRKHHLSVRQLLVVNHPGHEAFTFGILQPRILISTGLINLLTLGQLEAVVLHEIYHLRQRHNRLLIISDLLATCLFFLPIIRVLVNKLRVICEHQADLYALNQQQSDRYLKLALARVIPSESAGPYSGFASQHVKERLSQLLEQPTVSHHVPLPALLISVLVVLLGLNLWFLPRRSQVLAATITPDHCGSQQCSIYCLTDSQMATFANLNYSSALYSSLVKQ